MVTPETLTWGQFLEARRGDDDIAAHLATRVGLAALAGLREESLAAIQELCDRLNSKEQQP